MEILAALMLGFFRFKLLQYIVSCGLKLDKLSFEGTSRLLKVVLFAFLHASSTMYLIGPFYLYS